MNRDYFQEALHTFNGGNWYGWKKEDGATMPSEAEVNAKIQELKDAEADAETKKTSGKQKLKDLGLDDDEINALMGA